MILAGIRSFTIIDDKEVTEHDLANDFFIQQNESSKNLKRGQLNANLLKELNPNVEGHYIDKDPTDVTASSVDLFDNCSALIVSMDIRANDEFVRRLSIVLHALNIPLIVIDVFGFIGYFRISYSNHEVIETHQALKNDLRLDKPIVGLMDHIKTYYGNLEDIKESKLHGEIPYAIIILYYINKWAESREDGLKFPSNYSQKKELKEIVKKGMLSSDEENFEEAINAINGSVTYREVSKDILDLFKDPRCQYINSQSNEFWVLVRALYEFYRNEGESKYLPISGTIPDMKSSTDNYIKLQKLYQNQSIIDLRAVRKHLNDIQASYDNEIVIGEDLLKTFCKNAHYLYLSETIPLHLEWDSAHSSPSPKHNSLNLLELSDLKDPESPLWLWLIIRARNKIISSSLRCPGNDPDSNEKDNTQIIDMCKSLLNDYNASKYISMIESNVKFNEFLDVLLKHSHLKGLATTSSLIGGLVAQELTKVITKHYIPISQSCIFDALNCYSYTFELKQSEEQ
ncbi:hypothetical protein K502DRAFT_326148 [Neoconidiobolus thromboides FSU 785]|nr:hypothetical protein K502DRAFT_326148 [Neoconidiobolus thromboides FSU 785]